MAISLSSLKSTKTNTPPKVLLYGVDGVGKTSLAAEFPNPIYLATEGETPPSDVDLQTPGTIESYDALLDVFGELLEGGHDFGTVIIDSLDGLEPLIWAATCRRCGVESLESMGFGKGYIEADSEWREYLSAVSALARSGLYVVQLAHPEIVRFDSPTTDPYSRYSPKLHKRPNAMVREQSDMVLFMNYRISLKTAEAGFNKKITHAEGGNERLIHFNEKAGFLAKSRHPAPDSIKYVKGKGFEEIEKLIKSAA